MKLIMFVFLGLTFWACKSSNDNFDPFDKDFSFHNKMNVAEYDTIWDTCGYWSFGNDNKSGLKTFYGFFLDDVIGKGFSLEIDKINTTDCDSLFYKMDRNKFLTDLFIQNPINLEEVKPKLLGLGVTSLKIISDSGFPFKLELTNSENATFIAWLRADCDSKGRIIRHLVFTNSKDEQNSA